MSESLSVAEDRARWIENIKQMIADNNKWLDLFQSGRMRLGERNEGSGWVDTPPREIAKREGIKANLTALLEKVQKRFG